MSFPEGRRRITSIPQQTSLNILRGGGTIRLGGDSSTGGARRSPRERTDGEPNWDEIVSKYVFKRPTIPRNARRKPPFSQEDRIECASEVIEGYNNNGDLGIILQFAGVRFTQRSFARSRHSKPDNPVFYIPICYNERKGRLFLATRADIFELQITPDQMDIDPFFQEELYLPKLTTTHDPTSMTAFQNNELVIVGYSPRVHL